MLVLTSPPITLMERKQVECVSVREYEGPRACRPGIAADGQVEASANAKEIRLVSQQLR